MTRRGRLANPSAPATPGGAAFSMLSRSSSNTRVNEAAFRPSSRARLPRTPSSSGAASRISDDIDPTRNPLVRASTSFTAVPRAPKTFDRNCPPSDDIGPSGAPTRAAGLSSTRPSLAGSVTRLKTERMADGSAVFPRIPRSIEFRPPAKALETPSTALPRLDAIFEVRSGVAKSLRCRSTRSSSRYPSH